MNNRDCKHGQLARSCNICDLEQEVNEKAKTIAAQQQILTDLAEILGVEAGDVDGLITRVERVRKDAERYQWLKDKRVFRVFSADMSGRHTFAIVGRPIGSGRNIDEAIDAEIDKALAGGEAG